MYKRQVRHCSECKHAVIDTQTIPVRVARHLSRCLRIAAVVTLSTPAVASESLEPEVKQVRVVTMGGIGSVVQYVRFESESATIRSEYVTLLDDTATVLKDHPEIRRLEVAGHSDATESAELGLTRANVVIAELVKRGVDRARLLPVGVGAQEPLELSGADGGSEINRRVAFQIL